MMAHDGGKVALPGVEQGWHPPRRPAAAARGGCRVHSACPCTRRNRVVTFPLVTTLIGTQVVSGAMLDRWTALSDEDVVSRVLDGQTALYEVLMRRYNERIYRAARSTVRHADEREDVTPQAPPHAYS